MDGDTLILRFIERIGPRWKSCSIKKLLEGIFANKSWCDLEI